jgi:hypothetical protein
MAIERCQCACLDNSYMQMFVNQCLIKDEPELIDKKNLARRCFH